MGKEEARYMHAHTHSETHLSHKKEWSFAICSNMDGPGEYYDQWNKSDKERQIKYVFTYMWNVKINRIQLYRNRLRQREQKVVSFGGSKAERGR